MRSILIYSDYGISEFSLKQLHKFMLNYFSNVKLIKSIDIKLGILRQESDKKILCMGGGFDMGYMSSLGLDGCKEIRNFVNSGGVYLGICAGAYFACDYIQFDLNGPLEVKGDRLLKFFNGNAIGPINRKFKYNSDEEACILNIRLSENEKMFQVYLNGGPIFMPKSNKFKTIALYELSSNDLNDSNKFIDYNYEIAILETRVGNGRCLLSGVHFEFDANDLDMSLKLDENKELKDYLFNRLNLID